jgi:hypothetical protein
MDFSPFIPRPYIFFKKYVASKKEGNLRTYMSTRVFKEQESFSMFHNHQVQNAKASYCDRELKFCKQANIF